MEIRDKAMKGKMKIAVIGAGSSYTPEIIEKLVELSDRLPVKQISLMDIDPVRLGIMLGFSQRYAAHRGYAAEIIGTLDRQEALVGADFVISQFRVGGNAARVNDEKIPLKFGLIGQETTGAGGFMKALRTVPVLLDIARDVERICPDAWIVNYTNPTGIVTEAVTRYTRAKIAGLCSGGLFPGTFFAKALGVDAARIRYDYFGLNHLNFSFNIQVDGKLVGQDVFNQAIDTLNWSVNKDLLRKMQLFPSPYLQYFYHTEKKVRQLLDGKLTRGEEVQLIEKDIFAACADEALVDKPEALAKRGGGGYSEVALGVIDAIYNNVDKWMVVNVPNRGTVRYLPDDAVIETGCLVNSAGIRPTGFVDLPAPVWGLIAAVKNYEQLAVEAAVTGSRDTALLALLAHPLAGDYDTVKPMLEELLEANRQYLPRFFPV